MKTLRLAGMALVAVVLGANSYASDTLNGHEWVDLGLRVKWATCNVGASSPSDYGDYFAWGETRAKSEYTEENSVTCGKSMCGIAGDATYDAAQDNWGGTWRLPTPSEMYELVSKCERIWTAQGGSVGYKITGPNGNSIFLPAAGWRAGTSIALAGERGYYWSATPDEDTYGAFVLNIGNGDFGIGCYCRNGGRSVRPVLAE